MILNVSRVVMNVLLLKSSHKVKTFVNSQFTALVGMKLDLRSNNEKLFEADFFSSFP